MAVKWESEVLLCLVVTSASLVLLEAGHGVLRNTLALGTAQHVRILVLSVVLTGRLSGVILTRGQIRLPCISSDSWGGQ